MAHSPLLPHFNLLALTHPTLLSFDSAHLAIRFLLVCLEIIGPFLLTFILRAFFSVNVS